MVRICGTARAGGGKRAKGSQSRQGSQGRAASPANRGKRFLPAHPVPAVFSSTGSSCKGKVLRKFLALSVITINCFPRVFIYLGSYSWSYGDSIPCSRGVSGLDAFFTGVKPERFQILH